MTEAAVESRRKTLDKLAQTGAGTGMGRLLRSFWQPVAVASSVAPGKARPLKIMGEELTLYRGASGTAYLVGGRCAHRRTVLHTGWVQGEDIRCMYHGWRYDGTGQCTQAPAEGDEFAAKVRIRSYPLKEYCGMVFAYMGEGQPPAFDLPRREALEKPGTVHVALEQIWPCNWLQLVENSLDAVHVSFVHHVGATGPFGEVVTDAIPELAYEETDAGIRQTARRSASNVRISDWTFPNNNHIVIPALPGDPWVDVVVWRVPVDDDHTIRFGIYGQTSPDRATNERFRIYFEEKGAYNPAEHHDDLVLRGIFPEDRILQLTHAQDYVAALGQGVNVDRGLEYLGASDKGIVLLRRLLRREMEAIEGGKPVKTWRRLTGVGELQTRAAQ